MITQTKRATATLAATALVASGLTFATVTTPIANADVKECVSGNPTDTVSVFGFNDFHGRVFDDSKPVTDKTAFLAGRLFTPVEQARVAQGDDNVLLISSGDNIGASTFVSMINDDLPTLDILNAAGVDVSTVGNHEFDKGWSDLSGRVDAASDFPYLGANVYETGTTNVPGPLEEYQLYERGGVTIAVVGVVTADVPSLVSPAGIAGLTFGDPAEAINRVTAQLLDGNPANDEADVVIASFHEGAANQNLTAEQNAADSAAFDQIYRDVDPRVSAIFNGHTHQRYVYTSTSGVPIIQTGSYAANMGKLDLVVDTTTKGVCSTTPTVTAAPATPDESLPAIVEINELAAAAAGVADELGREVIGDATEAISTPGTGGSGTRDHESPMSNAVAEMFFDTLSNGDAEFIGLQNPGGTRDSFNAGDITFREAAMTLPFANSLFTTQITGAQLKTVLEQQWQRDANGGVPSRAFLALGTSKNLTYTYDESLAEGSRITSISMNGKPIDPTKTYTVGSGSFLIAGGDNFWELAKGTNTRDTGRADLEAWVDWVRSESPLSPDYSKRGVSAKLATGTLVEGGDDLDFSFGKPLDGGVAPQTLDMYLQPGEKVTPPLANRQVRAFIGNTQVGSGTVSNGAGSVSVWLPDGTSLQSGDYTLRFQVLDSGTNIYVPVKVETKAKPTPTPTAKPTQRPDSLYTTPGVHRVNGRLWVTTCEPYSKTERCTTEIWATQIRIVNGKYKQVNDFVFNNMTYLPSARSLWKDNPLGTPGDHVVNGRQWRTECDTALTGRNACRSSIKASVIERAPGGGFRVVNKYVLNNIVMFS